MGLGRKGDLVANTPMRLLPPRRGGRTVGDHAVLGFWLKSQMSQMWEKPSRPRMASGFRNSCSKVRVAVAVLTSPLWRGMPNFPG